MERLSKRASLPNFLTRLLRSNSMPRTDKCSRIYGSSRATNLEQHDIHRAFLPPMPTDLSRNDQKRWFIFDEIITHEQNYLDALLKLQYVIFNELSEGQTFVAKDILQTIFGTHQHICKLHQFVQALLEQCVKNWPKDNVVGWMILAMVEQPTLLHWYDNFIKSHKRTIQLYTEETKQNSMFAWFVNNKLLALGEQRKFQDYFIMPVQRIPQLLLQLKELFKYTPETHKDRAMMDRCIRRITYLNEQLNAASGRNELVAMVLHAIKEWNPAISRTFIHDRSQCLLLHSDTLGEKFKNGFGSRIVLLLSDRIVCAKLPAKRSENKSSEQRVGSPFRPQPKAFGQLKWVVPLQELDVECGELGECELQSAECKAHIDSIRDFGTLSSVRELMSTFHDEYDTLSVDTCSENLDKIWSTVLSSDEAQDDAKLICIKTKKGKTRKLMTKTPDDKKELCYNIRLAQLALWAENRSGWWNSALYTPYEALLSTTFEAGDMDGVWSVTGACCFVPNTSSSAYSNELFRAWSKKQHVLSVISKDKHSSKISLYNHDRKTNRLDNRASIDLPNVRVSSMVYVPEGQVGDTATDTVWIATRTRILIYSATYPMIDKRLKSIRINGSPSRLFYHGKHVYVSTVNGRLLIFSINSDGVWDMQKPQQCRCGFVTAMCAINSNIYMTTRARLYVYNETVGKFVMQLSPRAGGNKNRRLISLLQHSLHGLWVAWDHCETISLYHATHHTHLLDINIDRHVARFLADTAVDKFSTPVYVTAMQIIEHFLWVGTNVGLVLSMQLPRSANVPIMVDEMAVAYHGHLADVSVILPLPSLRAPEHHQEPEPLGSDVDPLLVDKLYKNTREPSRDFIASRQGIADLDVSFIDSQDNLNASLISSRDNISLNLTKSSAASTYLDQNALDELDLTFTEILNDTGYTLEEWDVSQVIDDGNGGGDGGDGQNNSREKACETKPDKERSTESSTWAPNSMLIITGGRGCIKRHQHVDLNSSLLGTSRSHSTSNLAELSDSWDMKAVDEKKNLILWEKRLTE